MPDQFQYIKLPDGSYGKFRSDASDEQIRSAISKDFPTAFKPKEQGGTPGSGKITGISGPAPTVTMVGGVPFTNRSNDLGARLDRFVQNLSTDITKGTTTTPVGRALKRLGAPGTESGEPPNLPQNIGKMATALLTGPGSAEMTSSFVPQTSRAGEHFEEVMQAAKGTPVNVEGPGKEALRAQELTERGGNPVSVITKFMRRVTDPDKGPLSYEEARDFYTNARLSMSERLMNKPNMWRQVTLFKQALGDAIEDAAASAGKLQEYQEAMREYRAAMNMRKLGMGAGAVGLGKAATEIPLVGGAIKGMVRGSLGH